MVVVVTRKACEVRVRCASASGETRGDEIPGRGGRSCKVQASGEVCEGGMEWVGGVGAEIGVPDKRESRRPLASSSGWAAMGHWDCAAIEDFVSFTPPRGPGGS